VEGRSVSRIPCLDDSQVAPQIRDLWEKAPFVLNINRLVAHAQTAYKPCMSLGARLLTRAELPARLRELAILRIAHLRGARYEWNHHVSIARNAGITDEEISGVREGTDAPSFSDLDRDVLSFTDELVRHARASEATFEKLRAHLSDREMVELMISVGYWNMIAMLIVNTGLEMEQE
jgi:4-carboxymuconolactone decarboxylase